MTASTAGADADTTPPGWRRVDPPELSPILQAALARDQLGEYQAQAAIAALHADAPSAASTASVVGQMSGQKV